MSKKTKIIIIVLVGLIIAYLIYLGILLFERWTIPKFKENIVVISWKTYRNKEYAFHINYISNWNIYDYQSGDVNLSGITFSPYSHDKLIDNPILPMFNITKLQDIGEDESIRAFMDRWKEWLYQREEGAKENSPELRTNIYEAELSGLSAIKVERTNVTSIDMGIVDGPNFEGVEYWLFRGRERFQITYHYPIVKEGQYRELFDKMTSSLEFEN